MSLLKWLEHRLTPNERDVLNAARDAITRPHYTPSINATVAPDAPDASVIIPHLRATDDAPKHLLATLRALAAQRGLTFEVIVVDNTPAGDPARLDAMRTAQEADFTLAWLATTGANTGFAAACNRGFAAARGRHLVTLNNDALPAPTWLYNLVATADRPPPAPAASHTTSRPAPVGMVASKILRVGEPIIDNIGHLLGDDAINRGNARGERDEGQYDDQNECLFASGCAALYPRAALAASGGFDERFFAYGDDCELGIRLRLKGFRALFAPSATVEHHYSATTAAHSPVKAWLVERNRLLVLLKYFTAQEILEALPYTATRLALTAAAAATGQGAAGASRHHHGTTLLAAAFADALTDTARMLPNALQERARLASLRDAGSTAFRAARKRYRLSPREVAFKP